MPAHSIKTRVDSATSAVATTTRSSGSLLVQVALARRRVLKGDHVLVSIAGPMPMMVGRLAEDACSDHPERL